MKSPEPESAPARTAAKAEEELGLETLLHPAGSSSGPHYLASPGIFDPGPWLCLGRNAPEDRAEHHHWASWA